MSKIIKTSLIGEKKPKAFSETSKLCNNCQFFELSSNEQSNQSKAKIKCSFFHPYLLGRAMMKFPDSKIIFVRKYYMDLTKTDASKEGVMEQLKKKKNPTWAVNHWDQMVLMQEF